LSFLYHELLFRPLFNVLIFLYNSIPGADFGVAIIVLTLIIRVVFFPLSIKALVSQREMNKLQPKIKELQDKYKNDKPALGQATMQLYKEHKVNPFSGCLPLLIQLPVLIALYSALQSGLKPESLNGLYSFVGHPGTINQIAIGFIDLTKKSPWMAILAGALQWFQLKQSTMAQAPASKNEPISPALQMNPVRNREDSQRDPISYGMNQQMLYFFPIMVIIIAWNLPTGLTLYWVAATVFSIFEQMYINRRYRPISNI
jgi:YidC/Oxa1 family membrane protein insertase